MTGQEVNRRFVQRIKICTYSGAVSYQLSLCGECFKIVCNSRMPTSHFNMHLCTGARITGLCDDIPMRYVITPAKFGDCATEKRSFTDRRMRRTMNWNADVRAVDCSARWGRCTVMGEIGEAVDTNCRERNEHMVEVSNNICTGVATGVACAAMID